MSARWKAWLAPLPLAPIVVGAVAGWSALGFMLVWLARTPPFDTRSRTTVAGQLETFAVVELGRSSRELDLVLAGQPLHLRVHSGLFRDVLLGRAPAALKPGAAVSALVSTDEMDASPAYVDALVLDGGQVLTLAQSRTWEERNRRHFWIALPLTLVGAVFLTGVALLRRTIRR